MEFRKKCKVCYYYEQIDKDKGFCKRYPPIIPQEFFSQGQAGENKYTVAVKPWLQPKTSHNNWCGEFKPEEDES